MAKGIKANFLFWAFFVFIGLSPCCAQDEKNIPLPVHLSSDNGFEIFDQENLMIGHKNVMVERGASTLYADNCRGYFTKNESGKKEIERMEMEGNTLMVVPEATAYSDKAVYSVPSDTLTLTGSNLRLYGKDNELFAKKAIIYQPEAKIAKAIGQAEVQGETYRLQGDMITAYFQEVDPDLKKDVAVEKSTPSLPGGDQLTLKKIEADGNVKLIMPDKVAIGDHGIYDAEKDITILIGNVKLSDPERQLEGEYAEVDRKTGISKLLPTDPRENLKLSTVVASPKKRVRAMLIR
jgi:lipopolysaccharide export system protein LptA